MFNVPADHIKLTKRQIKGLVNNPEKTARAVDLLYVSDRNPGIERIRKNEGFEYRFQNKTVRNKELLSRIKKLVIPPAWENVWICPFENGHLQVTGIDSKNRKQYKYHPLWNQVRSHTKFYRMIDFGKALPETRVQLKKDLAKPGFPQEKILATIVSMLEHAPIRIGNNAYEKLYGSYGLTTLKNHHVKIFGNELVLQFKGKKNIPQHVSIHNRKLAKIVKQCIDIPGRELFQYYDENGEIRTVDSGMVNDYIKEISEGDFTAKDFRTWAGTVQAFKALREAGIAETKTGIRKAILDALDNVSGYLGNTRNVCKKYYVHPLILSLYESSQIAKYLDEIEPDESISDGTGFSHNEKMVMKILSSI